MVENRRLFSRIAFHTNAWLQLPDGEVGVDVIDLSLKGALVKPSSSESSPQGTRCVLKIVLDEAGAQIRMETIVAHQDHGHLGLACQEIDLDSITHLRRLITLNLGDETLLERELSKLVS